MKTTIEVEVKKIPAAEFFEVTETFLESPSQIETYQAAYRIKGKTYRIFVSVLPI